MLKVNTAQYGSLLRRCWETKQPLQNYGPPGIGKSEIPVQVFRKIAPQFPALDSTGKEVMKDGKPLMRQFVKWNDFDHKTLFANPGHYFVFTDIRLSQCDPSDIRGLPFLAGEDRVVYTPPTWAWFFINPSSMGCVFFDEMNLAAPIIQGSAYQFIHDRVIGDHTISKHVLMIAAGNRADDAAYTFEMATPLRDRFCEVEMIPSAEEWAEWSYAHNVNRHLVNFILWKNSYLLKGIGEANYDDKPTTPRGIVRASKMIGDLEIITNAGRRGNKFRLDEEVETLIAASCGSAFAHAFGSYVEHYQSLDWAKLLAHPKTVSDFDSDMLWIVIGGLAEKYGLEDKSTPGTTGGRSKIKYQERMTLDDILKFHTHLPAEFEIMLYRLMKAQNYDRFKREALGNKQFTGTVLEKYGKFIAESYNQ